ncbi:Transporter, LysE family [Leucobacter sp. 7(1)]|uniref:LysE family translocator n=1 Tax=Leucobacter sp. 7(1) TaxID=1255613 RepID=UPI00097ED295|nr:LysE family translocator [Leucobacter sp. 7(1)]SJN09963.1 Transporter, LysE family [Leucobacter sp. 7(1)]
MDGTLMLQFWAIAILLALTPGPDWAFAIATGLRPGSVIPSVLGMAFGYVVMVGVLALGAGTLVTTFPPLLTALTVLGAAYLAYLGVTTLRGPVHSFTDTTAAPSGGFVTQFLRGAGVSGFNPKGLLLLLALLPQFTSAGAAWRPEAQMFVLGLLHVANCIVIYFAVAHGSRRLLGTRPRAGMIITKVAGVTMIALGLLLVAEQIVAVIAER